MLHYSEDHHREFVPLILALMEHVALSTPDCRESITSKLKDILRYGGNFLRFGQISRGTGIMEEFIKSFALLIRQG